MTYDIMTEASSIPSTSIVSGRGADEDDDDDDDDDVRG
jgi:hypothetical protein